MVVCGGMLALLVLLYTLDSKRAVTVSLRVPGAVLGQCWGRGSLGNVVCSIKLSPMIFSSSSRFVYIFYELLYDIGYFLLHYHWRPLHRTPSHNLTKMCFPKEQVLSPGMPLSKGEDLPFVCNTFEQRDADPCPDNQSSRIWFHRAAIIAN